MKTGRLAAKREVRLVELIKLIQSQDSIVRPEDASLWAEKFGVCSTQIRGDIRFLRKEGYLPSARLSEIKKKYKPMYMKDGAIK